MVFTRFGLCAAAKGPSARELAQLGLVPKAAGPGGRSRGLPARFPVTTVSRRGSGRWIRVWQDAHIGVLPAQTEPVPLPHRLPHPHAAILVLGHVLGLP